MAKGDRGGRGGTIFRSEQASAAYTVVSVTPGKRAARRARRVLSVVGIGELPVLGEFFCVVFGFGFGGLGQGDKAVPADGAEVTEGLPYISQNPADVAIIPFHGTDIQSVEIGGEPYVVFRPLVESIGLGYGSQTQKLNGKSWATVTKIVTAGSDGKRREMTAINLKTLTMWLATIDEDRVNEESRPLVVAYQNEVAEAVESYFTKGTAINPRVTESQPQDFSETISVSKQQLELIKMAEG